MSKENVEFVRQLHPGPDVDLARFFRDDIIWAAQERTVQGRPLCARNPSPDAEILGHRLLVATAPPRHLGNCERVFCPKRLEHGAIVARWRACATVLEVVSGLLPV